MKRIPKLIIFLMLGVAIPLISASGQDKKNEKKVKVIVVDESGTNTVIDTTFTGDKMPGTITLDNGKIIHLTRHGIDLEDLEKGGKGKHVLVTVSTDNDGESNIENNIVVIGSDSTKWDLSSQGEKGKVYAYSYSSSGKPGKHMIIASAADEPDAPKYIIAKDGIVVTIQTDDEAKAKEIKQLIEDKLGVKKSDKK